MSESPESIDLKPQQRRVLIQLAFLKDNKVDKISDLKPNLDPKFRADLKRLKLIEEKKAGRGTSVALADAGWRWVMENLECELPAKEQVAPVLMDVLKALNGFLRANRFDIQDVIRQRPVVPPLSARDALLQAADELGGVNATQIRLRDLRPKLSNFARPAVDAAIRELQIEEILSVIPIDLPTDIDDRDREAAIEIAGMPRHAIIVRNR
jgi:hypothetical protein